MIGGQRVLLDSDLAALYGVTTKAFNQAVRRNIDRFPDDFLLQLTDDEANSLRSQIVTLKTGWGQHRKYLPLTFTEHGCPTRFVTMKRKAKSFRKLPTMRSDRQGVPYQRFIRQALERALRGV